ncbi:hypothetical protein TA3x_001575 [Tundrisphaera sp. TA3]|uniref:hypothetical protein n=1 Tax=Tundrisphaera sp. TA3 TaxID=3435775 RepID=UPI003EBE1220
MTPFARNSALPRLISALAALALLAGPTPAKGQEPRPPEAWAVLVGIDRYEDPAIPGCNAAVRDAREVRRWFLEAGWGARNLLLLQDQGVATPGRAEDQVADLAPTGSNLAWATRDWLGARARPGDLVVIYFAGQAIGVPPPPGAAPGTPGREYLLPSDARLANLDRTGWSIESTIDALASGGRNPVVCWLDTSLQGRTADEPDRKRASGAAPTGRTPGKTMLGKLARWPDVTAWLAADGSPASEGTPAGGRSRFVDALIRGLGRPDRPRNLLACLDAMNRDPALARQGFRTLGNIPPDRTLWAREVRVRADPPDRWLLPTGHGDRVTAAAFTADGGRLATASMDSTVKIWRAGDRTLLRGLPDSSHIQGIDCLALGPDGRWLATGDGRGQVRFWDLAAGDAAEKPRDGPHPHRSRITSLTPLPDARHFVSADKDGQAWLWEIGPRPLAPRPLAAEVTSVAACAGAEARVVLAVAAEQEPIRLFGPSGEPVRELEPPGGTAIRLALSPDGNWLAAGIDGGDLAVWDLAREADARRVRLGGEADRLAISASGRLAAAVGESVLLVDLGREGPPTPLAVAGRPEQMGFSADGRYLGLCDRARGRVQIWRMGDGPGAVPVTLEGAESGGQATSLAFAPDGTTLAAGDQDGGIRAWDLPAGDLRGRIPARRGRLAGVGLSDDSRIMLTITRDLDARVWDLRDGGGYAPIAGRWTSGAIAPDASFLALARSPDGEVVVVDRASGRARPTPLARPLARGGSGPVSWQFGASTALDGDQMVAISPDGRLIAACSSEGPLACVWEAETGRLRFTIAAPDHEDKMSAVAFSADSRSLATSDAGGTTRLWGLDAAGERPRPLASFASPGAMVTAVRFDPGDRRRVAIGSRDGRILIREEGRDAPADRLRESGPPVRAIVFSRDRSWIAASGEDKSIWAWPTSNLRRPIRLEPGHGEQVTALAAMGAGLIASGSDDATVRFWNLAGTPPRLLGTLAALPAIAPPPGPPRAASEGGSWVVYTPEGLFDGSPGSADRVTLLRRDEVLPLGNFYETHHAPGLSDQIRRGQAPGLPRPAASRAPLVAIDPPARPVQRGQDRDVVLTISLGEADARDVRLYQNGVPVRDESGLDFEPGRRRIRATVRLRGGPNRFYLMAGRPGSSDGRSNEVEVRYDGPDNPGQMHVLAIGVSRYRSSPLRFARRDAEEVAAHLGRHGFAGSGAEGERIVLADGEVSQERVEAAFGRLKERARGRPQDTIVVFLAGHTGIIGDRFCLLLPEYPFPGGRPAATTQLATRGPLADGPAAPPADAAGHVLPYSRVYGNLARIDALNRLVIVDACQAGALLDDEGVLMVRRRLDDGAHRSRTTYLLAARRGEPAGESAALQHGLLTYALLKGMGAPGLEPLPGASPLDRAAGADADRDGVITTAELQAFAGLALPELASRFPALARREGPGPNAADPPPRVLAVPGDSFPLVEVPGGER